MTSPPMTAPRPSVVTSRNLSRGYVSESWAATIAGLAVGSSFDGGSGSSPSLSPDERS